MDKVQLKSCLFQKTSFNFILLSMLLEPSFLKHTKPHSTKLPVDVSGMVSFMLMGMQKALSQKALGIPSTAGNMHIVPRVMKIATKEQIPAMQLDREKGRRKVE